MNVLRTSQPSERPSPPAHKKVSGNENLLPSKPCNMAVHWSLPIKGTGTSFIRINGNSSRLSNLPYPVVTQRPLGLPLKKRLSISAWLLMDGRHMEQIRLRLVGTGVSRVNIAMLCCKWKTILHIETTRFIIIMLLQRVYQAYYSILNVLVSGDEMLLRMKFPPVYGNKQTV